MQNLFSRALIGISLIITMSLSSVFAASGSGLGGALSNAMGGKNAGAALGLPSLSGDMAGNAAGVLQYCIEHKYLSAMDADKVKDKLLDKAGLSSTKKDDDYEQGLQGILSGKDGKSVNFDSLKGKLKDKACDYVLENAGNLL